MYYLVYFYSRLCRTYGLVLKIYILRKMLDLLENAVRSFRNSVFLNSTIFIIGLLEKLVF